MTAEASWYESRRRRVLLTPRPCLECGTEFVSHLPHKLTCGDACKKKRARAKARTKLDRVRNERLKKTCSMCGVDFVARRLHTIFCSDRCSNYGHHLKKQHGMTPADYRKMVDSHAGICAMCGEPGEKLVVDHCHSTGKVRGLIHQNCNVSLGVLQDKPSMAIAAAIYLVRHGC